MTSARESQFESYNRGYNVGVGGAVVNDGRLLLVRRASAYGHGNWQIPGGFIERSETLQDAVLREVQEEAGVKAEIRGILAVRSRFDDRNSTYVVFLLDWESGDPKPDGGETDDARWFTFDEIASLDKLPPINLEVARSALGGAPSLLTGVSVESIGGGKYTLFVG